MPIAEAVITREPKHPGYDTLGDADNWGEEFHLLINGDIIGGTYWCPVSDTGRIIEAGKQWASYGPVGYSIGHRTREDAEQVQLEAAGITTVTASTVDVPAPAETDSLPADAYDKALIKAARHGIRKCGDAARMAFMCEDIIRFTVGSGVSGRLVWQGAQKRHMTTKELLRLCVDNPMAVEALMWL